MKDLSKIILSEPLIARVIAADDKAFLVGGYVRDILRGVRSKDIDFVIGGDVTALVARVFAGAKPTVVQFKRGMTLRVVTGDYTIDFSEIRGSLEEDLALRDFTMNAIAWSARAGLSDPLNGAADIKANRIRGISEKNFVDDPLRLLRAYRFAGELGWEIGTKTRKTLARLKHLIARSAVERITLETIKLLNSQNCLGVLKMALKDGLLCELFSLDKRELEVNIRALSRFDSYLKKVHEVLGISLDRTLTQGLTYTGLLRAEQLLSGADTGRNHLRFSRATLKRLTIAVRLLPEYKKRVNMNRSLMFEMFTEAGIAAMDLALLTQRQRLLREAERFLSTRPVLSTQKVMEITGRCPGPELGALLKDMKRLQFLGKLGDEDEAMKWLTERSPQTSGQ